MAVTSKRRRASTPRVHRWLAPLLGLALVLAACGGDDPAPADPPPATDPGDADTDGDADDGDDGDTDAAPAPATDQRLILGHPGHLRPIWASTWFYIAEEFGFFQEYGVTVALRPLRSGGDVTQATHTGEIDGGLSATAPAIGAMARDANVMGVMGLDQVDWLLVTNNPDIQTVEDLAGRQSGAMAPGDSRWLILQQILDEFGVDIDDVDTIDLTGDHIGPLIAGVVDTHVVHVDELAEVQHVTGEEWRVLTAQSDVADVHYLPLVANKDSLAQKEDAWIRAIAALIDTIRFMHDPDNFEEIVDFLVQIVDQDDRDLVAEIYQGYIDFNWWQLDEPGIDPGIVQATIDTQLEVGAIEQGFDYDHGFTTEYWERAMELVG